MSLNSLARAKPTGTRRGGGLMHRNIMRVMPGPYGVAVKGEVLREQMRLRGLTGAALARATGLSDATISNALAGRRVHPVTFRKIAAHLAQVDPVPGAEALAVGR